MKSVPSTSQHGFPTKFESQVPMHNCQVVIGLMRDMLERRSLNSVHDIVLICALHASNDRARSGWSAFCSTDAIASGSLMTPDSASQRMEHVLYGVGGIRKCRTCEVKSCVWSRTS